MQFRVISVTSWGRVAPLVHTIDSQDPDAKSPSNDMSALFSGFSKRSVTLGIC